MPTRGKKQPGRKSDGERGQVVHLMPATTDGPPGSKVPPMLMDRRLMERHLAKIQRLADEQDFATPEEMDAYLQGLLAGGGQLPDLPPRTPLEEAQELVYQALEATGRRRTTLARKALAVSPDCAEAYIVLAEGTKDPDKARDLYEQGVEAGLRAIPQDMLDEWTGELWQMLPARPYLRARQGLAEVLWHLGERQVAIEHLQEILRLNTGDNQGVRYQLIAWLLTAGDSAGARKLLDTYKDDYSACWEYSRALQLFRQYGPGRRAQRALDKAIEFNPFVVGYLLGVAPWPKERPPFVEPGGPSEAFEYVLESAEAWAETPGAIEWFAEAVLPKLMEVATAGLGDE